MSDDSMVELAISEAKDKMAKAVEHTRAEFASLRTGRATPALVENLRVEAYGSTTPLKQLAGFSVPEARTLVIQPYDKGTLKDIEKALQNSDLGINPSNDGSVIRLAFPPLTQDRRKELVKIAKAKSEDGKVTVRNARRDARKDLEGLQKDGALNTDDLDRAEKDLDKVTNEFVAEIDKAFGQKESELLEV
jgi:ribosome recycling factor